jgi:hypothetical protein
MASLLEVPHFFELTRNSETTHKAMVYLPVLEIPAAFLRV